LKRAVRGTDRRASLAQTTLVSILVGTLPIGSAPAGANPVPDAYARAMNERPVRWLTHPTREDELRLIQDFGRYGLSHGLLDPKTFDVLDRNFDRFAPLLVSAQRPPRPVDQELQRWFRDRAAGPQRESMKQALREWLVADVHEAPPHGSMQTTGPGEAVAREIFSARLQAAEALGDWQDRDAIPLMHKLLERLPLWSDHYRPRTIIQAAIDRITDPGRAGILVVARDGQLAMHRPFSELDSVAIEAPAPAARATVRWMADVEARRRVWTTLQQGRLSKRGDSWNEGPPDSIRPRQLTLYFDDGWEATVLGGGGRWLYSDNTRSSERIEITNAALGTTLAGELRRAGITTLPQFVSESVTLRIAPGELDVTGMYDFEGSPSEASVDLRYPIAIGDGLGPPRVESVVLRRSSTRERLSASFRQEGISCTIQLSPGTAREYQLEVRYRQPLSGRTAKYLITTARTWGEPLRRASFEVITPDSIPELTSSLPLREVTEARGRRRYRYETARFTPTRELIVSW
jgi:hypothetical protein